MFGHKSDKQKIEEYKDICTTLLGKVNDAESGKTYYRDRFQRQLEISREHQKSTNIARRECANFDDINNRLHIEKARLEDESDTLRAERDDLNAAVTRLDNECAALQAEREHTVEVAARNVRLERENELLLNAGVLLSRAYCREAEKFARAQAAGFRLISYLREHVLV